MQKMESRREFVRSTALLSVAALLPPILFAQKRQSYDERTVAVLGKRMAYLTCGKGTPIVFFHGNPTRAYLWRNIFPFVSSFGRCIAPDLIGMGNSEKLTIEEPGRYTYDCHKRYINSFLNKVLKNNERIIIVGHDWGGVLAHDWARNNEARVKGIAFMETFLEPHVTGRTPEFAIKWFQNFRTDAAEISVLQNNMFVEQVFLQGLPNLSEEVKEIYRAPFKEPGEGRLPTLIWPREAPIDGNPQLTTEVFQLNMEFMANTKIPKLFINAEPGALLGNEPRRAVIRQWPNLTEVKVKGNHYIQEQCPDDIGNALAGWIRDLS